MKRLNQTEPPIFVILRVLCFQGQSFLTFILSSAESHLNGEQMPGLDFAHVQDDVNPHILRMLKGIFFRVFAAHVSFFFFFFFFFETISRALN